jgi:hypothetical protein
MGPSARRKLITELEASHVRSSAVANLLCWLGSKKLVYRFAVAALGILLRSSSLRNPPLALRHHALLLANSLGNRHASEARRELGWQPRFRSNHIDAGA